MDKRRTTLGAFHHGGPGIDSGIPQSTRKVSNNKQIYGGRMSMAVPQRVVSRQSILPTAASEQLGVPSTVGRQGHMYSSHNLALGMSGARSDAAFFRSSLQAPNAANNQAQAYAPPSIRRSSIGGRRQSMNPSQPPMLQQFILPVRIAKDSRNVRDRAFMARCQADIIDFLTLHNFPDNLTAKTLAQPTGKDFANIFKFIYTLYDPSHRSWGKKFEDDVTACLRASGYPFADSISKSHIQAVGNMHSWPGIVAALHWLITAIKAREQTLDGYDEVRIDINAPSQQQYASLDEEERPQAKTEFWAEYLAGLYPAFLASEDYDAKPWEERLEERFEMSNERARVKAAALREECEKLQGELDRLDHLPSGLELKQKEQQYCQKDMASINKYVTSLQEKSNKLTVTISEFKRKIAELELVCDEREAERMALKQQVDAQGLSDHEIQRLTSDRHQLDEAHRVTSAKLSEAMQQALDLEVNASRTYARVEKLAETYHTLATKLGLLPTGPEGYEDVNFAQELNGSAKTAAGLVPDCMTRIRPAILNMKQSVAASRHEDGNRVIQVEEEVARLVDKIQDASEVVNEQEAKYQVLVGELNASREALNQYVNTSHVAIEQTTRQIADLKNHLSGGLLAADQRLQALENEHSRLLADVERLRIDNHEAFAEALESVISYKQYITTRIEEMVEAVEAQSVV